MARRPFAIIMLLVLAGPACADRSTGADGGGGASSGSPSRTRGDEPNDLLFRWGYQGGFTPPEYQLTSLPAFSLYDDGTIVRSGPQIEIYPAPAIPSLESVAIDDDGVGAIIEAAFDADLDTMGDLTDIGTVGIADAAETVFTLDANGVERTVRVYALDGLTERPEGMPDAEYEARRRLLRLVERLGSLESWLPPGSIGSTTPYEPTGVRVYVAEYRGEPEPRQPELEWPLATPLASIGEDVAAGIRCVAVTGADWTERLLPVARSANQLTPWSDGGQRFALSFRPLLPDETAC